MIFGVLKRIRIECGEGPLECGTLSLSLALVDHGLNPVDPLSIDPASAGGKHVTRCNDLYADRVRLVISQADREQRACEPFTLTRCDQYSPAMS